MNRARLWVLVFAAGTVLLGLLWAWSLQTPAFTGDLTRVALLSEQDFGPRDPQPVIDPALLVATPLDHADVVVVGDSFSASRLWQSALVARGLRVATLHHRETVGLCARLFVWLRERGFRGHTVVFESVERDFDKVLKAFDRCDTPRTAVNALPAGAPGVPPRAGGSATLLTGPMSLVNTRLALHSERERVLQAWGGGTRVRVRTLPQGCEVFSHGRCGRGLFLATDEERPALSDATLQAMQRLHDTPRDLRLVWMVMPNKTTMYRPSPEFERFSKALPQRGLGPDLYALLAALPGRDVYLPHDTHLSNRSNIAVGQAMSRAVAASSDR